MARRGRKPHSHPRKCIFCGNVPVTGEHIWPQWMHSYLPKLENPYKQEAYHVVRATGWVRREIKKPQQGHPYTKQIYNVCRRCNGIWMNQIEEETKYILIPLLRGLPLKLTLQRRAKLARWIMLKMIIIDQEHPVDAVVSQRERIAFWRNKKIPLGTRIFITCHNSSDWYTSYWNQTGKMGLPGYPPPPGRFKNFQSTALGIGRLLAVAWINASRDFDLKIDFEGMRVAHQLWPLQPVDIDWPTFSVLKATAMEIAFSFGRFIGSDRVDWRPYPLTI